MQEGDYPLTLSEIAENAAFSMSDVAFIAGLEESTVYRLWENPNWLEKVSGKSLQALIATVPGLGEYVATYSVQSRRTRLIEDLTVEGLEIDESAIQRFVREGIPEQYLTAALQAAIHIMRGDNNRASSYLARFWGTGQDRALTALFGTDQEPGLITNATQLIDAAANLAPNIGRKSYSFHTIITQAVFGHYIGKATGHANSESLPAVTDRQSAFTLRSSTMGLLIASDDRDLAERYQKMVRDTPVLRTVEEWSFPTYTRDTRPNSDFTLPRSLLLRNTANEILSEINSSTYGQAYRYYLISTYLPLALRRDATFGLRADELIAVLLRWGDESDDISVRTACESLAKHLRSFKR
jgi:hypothetical protein